MADIQIRPVIREDLKELKDLMRAYIVDFYKGKKPEDSRLENHILHILNSDEAGTQFVAVGEDGTLAGFATLYFSFSTTRVQKIAILNDLFVDAAHRGSGIGEKLFRHVLQFTKNEDYAYLTWQTAMDNTSAQALYKKMGGKNINSEWIHYEIEWN
ncbi:GNAT family N-acetyltransferase [Fictibacillus phosphorivorans]|uniref:GNAT family N-acetyltransferase n=1 Tax=Fictibacillus phosphorivorans TaxID=1221500 RepID=UPI00203BC9CE|nr:GNAT family N-acetyltransferase [Fictibacillus phosphorivorans]MCM3718392.1 GNAT family N-acetyltransferase [Fictibacillus phosphorivorans]MCM3776016.1 GNAT family N-acetyltransferase [Fictibacillus phosphorivorans]